MAEERFRRKLTSILSADVAGYSRLMAEDETATVKTLETYREVMSTLIKQHRGRVVDSPGDSLLAEFPSVVDAVQCAVSVQKEFQARNAELLENRRMHFRIGINLGDVIEEGERIYGDGVNIAARLEALADPGGICVSKTAFDQIETKLPLGYEYLGEQPVKNIPKPVVAYRVLMEPRITVAKEAEKEKAVPMWRRKAILAGAVALVLVVVSALIWNFYFRQPAIEPASVEKMAFPLPKKPSIAVMPFENLSGDPEQEYIADGISENIISALSRIPEMFVIARHSTFAYKGKHVEVKQVSEHLGVRYVLEGTIQKSGNKIRATAQLIDATIGHHLWSEQYDRETEGLFDLLDEITQKIVLALQVKLTHGEQLQRWAKGTENLEAWGNLSKGVSLFWRMRKEDNAKAREFFEQAVKLDSDYAVAWTWLASTYLLDVALRWTESSSSSYKKSLQLTQKALALDDSNPLAHALLGEFHGHRGQYGKAIAEGKKAVSLGPNNALVHWLLADAMQESRRPEEAIELCKKAMRLQPYYPALYLSTLAVAYHQAGRYKESLAAWEQLVERSRKGEFKVYDALSGLILTSIELERKDEARHYAEELFKIKPTFSLSGLANVLRLYGDRAQLERLWTALRKTGIIPPLLSSAEEFRYEGSPAFVVKYPKGRTRREFNIPELIFEAETHDDMIEFNVYVSDIPDGAKLEDIGPKVFASIIEREVGASVDVLSNKQTELEDGTKAFKTEMEWMHRRGFHVTFLLVSAFKDNKSVGVGAVTVGDPSEIEKLLESLKFTPSTIPVTGNIQQVRGPDSILNTLIIIFIGRDFTGKLPEDIDTITVTGPSGELPIRRRDFLYSSQFREFWIEILGSPEIGTYTFTVASGNVSGTAADTQSVLRTLPIPDTDTFSPLDGEKISSIPLTFSWGAVDAEEQISYRLDINDLYGNRVYMTDFVQGMLSHTVPVDKLVSGQSYVWRVRAADSSEWDQIQNRVNSDWRSFKMAPALSGIPIVGVIKNVHEPDNSYATYIDIVIGKEFTKTLPDDIDTIKVTGPSGDLPISKDDFTYYPQWRDFCVRIPGSPETGTYTFKLTSGDIGSSAIDTQNVLRKIPILDPSTLSPAEGETLNSKTPTFSWGGIEYPDKTMYYRFEVRDELSGSWVIHSPRVKNMLSYTVSEGIIKAGKTYIWRVRVTDNDDWNQIQNRTHTEWRSFKMAQSLK